MTELAAGQTFAGYVIEGVLGRGGMGIVYRARRIGGLSDRAVALKVIRSARGDDDRVAARFRDEARRASSLEHPAIVPVYDADEADGVPYIVMRFIPGRDLNALIRARGPLDVALVQRIAEQLADALDTAHAAGVVHRDVKPHNVLVDGDGRAYLTDFGLARLVGASDGHTAADMIVGTLAYIAPEQSYPDAVVDGRADQYGLACTLFEALCGRPPFMAEDDVRLVLAHRLEPPPAPSSWVPEAAAFDAPLARAMAKEPAARHESCSALAAACAGTAIAYSAGPFVRRVALVGAGGIVDREDDIAALLALLENDGERLVTLIGPGGTGKTTLALIAAQHLADPFRSKVAFCDLAPVTEPTGIAAAVGTSLGVRERDGVPTLEAIASSIQGQRLLLILDNLEHLLDGVSVVSDLLAACPSLVVLATSRAPLRLAGERLQPVGPLRPDEAVELLALRARQADPTFDDRGDDFVAQAPTLCARLDNLPLAIELAAPRLRLFSLQALIDRLAVRLPLLTGGRRDAPERQRTLRATLDWSHDLLGRYEQQVLARLAVFSGGSSTEAAETVCDATVEQLVVLVDLNLVRRGEGRLTLLETIREYALERLRADGGEEQWRRRHADWFLALGERAAGELYGAAQLQWLDLLDPEMDNVRSALEWLLGAGEIDEALRLATSLWVYWEARRAAEGRRILGRSLERATESDPRSRACAQLVAGHLQYFEGDSARAEVLLRAAVETFRELDDHAWLAVALSRLSWVALDRASPDEARELAEDALGVLEHVTEPWARAETLNYTGVALGEVGQLASGRALLEQARVLFNATGNAQRAAEVLNNLGWLSMLERDFDRARIYHAENLEVARRTGDGFRRSLALGNIGLIEALCGNLEQGRPIVHENLCVLRERGERRGLAEALVTAAAIAGSRSDIHASGRLTGASEAMYQSGGSTWNGMEIEILERHVFGRLTAADEAPFAAARAEGRSLSFREAIEVALVVTVDDASAAGFAGDAPAVS